jgi:hypothetical protein
MGSLNKHKTGLVLGAFIGLWHLTWASLVAIGVAQSFIDWIFRLHFIQPPYTITPFRAGLAAGLVLVTSVSGYLFGWVLAALWNWLHPATTP